MTAGVILVLLFYLAGKTKNQRFKNKKKGSLLKQRSKSAERVEDSSYGRQHSDDFEEKLRVWSVKQGYHPTYYSEIRTSIGLVDNCLVTVTHIYNNKIAVGYMLVVLLT